jgi:DNA polymerase-3 subunit delta
MIIKNIDLKKNLKGNKNFLLHGINSGLINQTIDDTLKPNFSKNVYNYDEQEILSNSDQFKEEIFNKSFFEEDKLIIINRASDKIKSILEEIIEEQIDDLIIIVKSGILDKKSKLRNFFEKEKKTIAIAYYEDGYRELNSIIQKFFYEKKIKISSQSINILIARSNGNRINLINELDKISNYLLNKNKIDYEEICKLTNLSENHKISDLTDHALANNKLKTLDIINENILTSEDYILIIKNFLYKIKRLKKLKKNLKENENMESVILSYKPPIFWKERDIIKNQLRVISIEKLNKLYVKVNNLEKTIKENSKISGIILYNFVLELLNTSSN